MFGGIRIVREALLVPVSQMCIEATGITVVVVCSFVGEISQGKWGKSGRTGKSM